MDQASMELKYNPELHPDYSFTLPQAVTEVIPKDPPSPPPDLPPPILTKVLRFLDVKDLKSCCYVSTNFKASAQPLLLNHCKWVITPNRFKDEIGLFKGTGTKRCPSSLEFFGCLHELPSLLQIPLYYAKSLENVTLILNCGCEEGVTLCLSFLRSISQTETKILNLCFRSRKEMRKVLNPEYLYLPKVTELNIKFETWESKETYRLVQTVVNLIAPNRQNIYEMMIFSGENNNYLNPNFKLCQRVKKLQIHNHWGTTADVKTNIGERILYLPFQSVTCLFLYSYSVTMECLGRILGMLAPTLRSFTLSKINVGVELDFMETLYFPILPELRELNFQSARAPEGSFDFRDKELEILLPEESSKKMSSTPFHIRFETGDVNNNADCAIQYQKQFPKLQCLKVVSEFAALRGYENSRALLNSLIPHAKPWPSVKKFVMNYISTKDFCESLCLQEEERLNHMCLDNNFRNHLLIVFPNVHDHFMRYLRQDFKTRWPQENC